MPGAIKKIYIDAIKLFSIIDKACQAYLNPETNNTDQEATTQCSVPFFGRYHGEAGKLRVRHFLEQAQNAIFAMELFELINDQLEHGRGNWGALSFKTILLKKLVQTYTPEKRAENNKKWALCYLNEIQSHIIKSERCEMITLLREKKLLDQQNITLLRQHARYAIALNSSVAELQNEDLLNKDNITLLCQYMQQMQGIAYILSSLKTISHLNQITFLQTLVSVSILTRKDVLMAIKQMSSDYFSQERFQQWIVLCQQNATTPDVAANQIIMNIHEVTKSQNIGSSAPAPSSISHDFVSEATTSSCSSNLPPLVPVVIESEGAASENPQRQPLMQRKDVSYFFNKRTIRDQYTSEALKGGPCFFPPSSIEILEGTAACYTVKEADYLFTSDLIMCICVTLYDPNKQKGALAHINIKEKVAGLPELISLFDDAEVIIANLVGGNDWAYSRQMEELIEIELQKDVRIVIHERNLGEYEHRPKGIGLSLKNGDLYDYSRHASSRNTNTTPLLPIARPDQFFH